MNRYPVNPAMTNASAEFSFLKGRVILVDGEFFCRYHGIRQLADRLASYLAANQMHLCLAKSAEAEIAARIDDPSTDPSYRRSLQSGLQFIRGFEVAGLIKPLGSENDSTAETFLKYIMLNRTSREIVVLTQQKWIFEDVSLLNSLRSVKAPAVQVRRLNNDGFLEPFQDNPHAAAASAEFPRSAAQPVSEALIRLGLA